MWVLGPMRTVEQVLLLVLAQLVVAEVADRSLHLLPIEAMLGLRLDNPLLRLLGWLLVLL